jgi:hypothetical protein
MQRDTMKNAMNSLAHKIIQIPVWLFELVTTAKSFKDNPIIGSAILNRIGLHVLRLVVSHTIMRARMWMLAFPISREDRQFYFSEGYLIKENFLMDDEFAVLEKEARAFKGDVREARQGDTVTLRAALSPEVLESVPTIKAFITNKKFTQLADFSSGHLRAPLYYLENVKINYSKGALDPQKTLHSDTFHPTMKCWFFLEDVTEEMGPFNYIPQSQKLTWKRIKWEYRMSLSAKNIANGLVSRGSPRFTEEDLACLGLQQPHTFTAKKNTLVIANTFGIHRRGNSAQKSTRMALWGDSRTNPFIPLPGIGGGLVNKLQYNYLETFRKKADERAAKRGGRSPWQLLDKEGKPFEEL